MIPVIRMQDIVNQFPDRTGHQLLGEEQGCVNGVLVSCSDIIRA